MRNYLATPVTPGSDPLSTYAASIGMDPNMAGIVGVGVLCVGILALVVVLEVLGFRLRTRRRIRDCPTVGRDAAERAMAAAFPQTGRVVQAPAQRREVTVGGRA